MQRQGATKTAAVGNDERRDEVASAGAAHARRGAGGVQRGERVSAAQSEEVITALVSNLRERKTAGREEVEHGTARVQ